MIVQEGVQLIDVAVNALEYLVPFAFHLIFLFTLKQWHQTVINAHECAQIKRDDFIVD